MRPQRYDCSAIIPHHCAIATAIQNAIRFWLAAFWGSVHGVYRAGTPTRHPKIGVRLGRSGAAQILRNSIDTYPRRLSGHQVLENGRSGYADEEDHE